MVNVKLLFAEYYKFVASLIHVTVLQTHDNISVFLETLILYAIVAKFVDLHISIWAEY